MNPPQVMSKCIVTGVIALAVISPAAQGAMEGAARVVRLKGAARVSTGNYVWQAINVGDVLRPGSIVQTSADPGSYIDLVLGDGKVPLPQPKLYRPSIANSLDSATTFQPTSEQNTVRLWSDGALGFDKLTVLQTGADRVTETQLDLKRGRITGNVKKLSAASKYEIKLPNGVAGVRGTVFDIQAVGIVKVYIGSMVVAWVDPRTQNVTTQTVTGGQVYDAALNQVALLSTDAMAELGEASASVLVALPFPASTTLASDRTVIGMSPVGANPASLPTPVASTPVPPIGVQIIEASRGRPGPSGGLPPVPPRN
jgi:FecR protein